MTCLKNIAIVTIAAVLGMAGCTGVKMDANVEVSVNSKKSPKPRPSKPVLPAKPASEPADADSAHAAQIAAPATPTTEAKLASEAIALALADSYKCSVCHKTEGKLLGPAWKAVAHKYKTDPDAVSKISINIKRGGNFGWKSGIMPAKGGSNISDADITQLAEFIASLK